MTSEVFTVCQGLAFAGKEVGSTVKENHFRGLPCKQGRVDIAGGRQLKPAADAALHMAASQLSRKQVTETHLPVLHQLVCIVHISCGEENRIS